MKKIFTLLAALLVGGAAASAADPKPFGEVFPANFDQKLPTGWMFMVNKQEVTPTFVNGGAQIICPQEQPKYRTDLKYNMRLDNANELNEENRFALDASEYKILAIQFKGKRPESGVFKLSNMGVLNSEGQSTWIKGAEGYNLTNSTERSWKSVGDIYGNYTYYYILDGENWTGPKIITKIEIVIADITNEADKSYTVAWVNWFKDEDDLKAHLNLDAVTLYDANGDKKAGYVGLKEAVDASVDGEKIVVNADVTVTDRIGINKNITIEGKEGTEKVKVSGTMNNKILLLANGKSSTVKNISWVYNGNGECSTPFIEASNGNLTMIDCEICNFQAKENVSVVNVKNSNSSAVHLRNVHFIDISVKDGRGEIYMGNGKSTLDGTTNGSITIKGKYSFTVGENFNPAAREEVNAVAEDVVPASNAVKLYIDETQIDDKDQIDRHVADGDVIVEGTNKSELFNMVHNDFTLAAHSDGTKLVAQKKQSVGIAGIEADENAPVEYFNLNGVQVKADNMTPGVYVRRQGKNVTKVMVK